MGVKRTEKLGIAQAVKARVANRDSCNGWPCCVLCGRPAPIENPLAFSCCHYIARSQGGLGMEENIVTLCPQCHREFDQGANRDAIRQILRQHLQKQYEDWDEEKLRYRKELATWH